MIAVRSVTVSQIAPGTVATRTSINGVDAATATLILAANANRKGFLIRNPIENNGPLFLALDDPGIPVTDATADLVILPGEEGTIPQWGGVLYGSSTAALNEPIRVVEF
jgi:hypothetical protein